MVGNRWPYGYQENFEVISIDPLKKAIKLLDGDLCLEIGCGNGYWTTELLVPKFREVWAVDLIEKPKYFDGPYFNNIGDIDPDKKFDAVYSFGVFCHLNIQTQIDYLKKIRKILTGKALISFANWDRHPSLIGRSEYTDGWYFNNLGLTKMITESCGFEMIDVDPTYRDTLALLW